MGVGWSQDFGTNYEVSYLKSFPRGTYLDLRLRSGRIISGKLLDCKDSGNYIRLNLPNDVFCSYKAASLEGVEWEVAIKPKKKEEAKKEEKKEKKKNFLAPPKAIPKKERAKIDGFVTVTIGDEVALSLYSGSIVRGKVLKNDRSSATVTLLLFCKRKGYERRGCYKYAAIDGMEWRPK